MSTGVGRLAEMDDVEIVPGGLGLDGGVPTDVELAAAPTPVTFSDLYHAHF